MTPRGRADPQLPRLRDYRLHGDTRAHFQFLFFVVFWFVCFCFFVFYPEHKWATSTGPTVLVLITFSFSPTLDPVALVISYLGLQSNLK